jgi:hypothetical protein
MPGQSSEDGSCHGIYQEVRMEQADFVVRGSSLPWLVLRCGTVSKPRKYAADGGGQHTPRHNVEQLFSYSEPYLIAVDHTT